MKLKRIAVLAFAALMSFSVFAGCNKPAEPAGPNDYLANPLTAESDAYYSRFTESWRSVKQEGWAINKRLTLAGNENKLNRALKLFDYLYSKDGNTLMSYGPEAWVNGTITYKGQEVPKLSAAALNELQDLEGGSYTNYYRRWLGGTMPVGYVKEQGMEFQTIHEKGKPGLENILTAIDKGTIDHTVVTSNENYIWTNIATPSLSTATAVELKLCVLYDSQSQITFTEANRSSVNSKGNGNGTWTAADGETYSIGDLKPVWKALGTKLNAGFINVVPTTGNVNANFTNMAITNYGANPDAFDVITGGATLIVQNSVGNEGKFINLLDYIDKMPNLKAFLDANPFIKATCLADNGKLFYAPYFDGYDDIERMFMMRTDWVEKLLDGTPAFDTAKTLDAVAYTAYMPESMNQKFTVVKADGSTTAELTKTYSKNIITVQNELTTRNGKTLTEALRKHIDDTYGNFYEKRSELFTGVNAAYDADELIALFRCIETNPALLSGDAATDMIAFYPRSNTTDRLMDLYRLMQIWGVRGLDGRNNYMYIGEDGTLKDTRLEPKTIAGLERLHELYKEGLILQDFTRRDSVATTPVYTGDDTFRGRLNAQNRGFMTYDYNQTSAVVNGLGDGTTPAIAGFKFGPVLPPFADWGYKAKPTADEPTFNTVPTALPFDKSTQDMIDTYTLIAGEGTTNRFRLSNNNGSATAASDHVWSDLIINGFGADKTVGVYTYKFISKEALLQQIGADWKGNFNLGVSAAAYEEFLTSLKALTA